jgi:hypothetical protein
MLIHARELRQVLSLILNISDYSVPFAGTKSKFTIRTGRISDYQEISIAFSESRLLGDSASVPS